jgi:hypothetical protein
MPRRLPSRRQIRALQLGADELIARFEWEFRARPTKLKNLRERYRGFCARLLREFERENAPRKTANNSVPTKLVIELSGTGK